MGEKLVGAMLLILQLPSKWVCYQSLRFTATTARYASHDRSLFIDMVPKQTLNGKANFTICGPET